MTRSTSPAPTPPRIWSRRTLACVAAAAATLLAIAIFFCVFFPVPLTLEEPEGALESVGLIPWLIALPVALLGVARAPTLRDRLDSAWLGTLAALAAARELDLHTRLNPEQLGDWGVRYRSDWWLDPGAPLGPKVLWAAAALALGLALLAFPLIVRAPALRLLRAGDTPTWLFVAAACLLGCGYLTDDIMRHSPYISKANLWRIEETFELLGSAAFLGSVACTARWPLTRRLAALP